MFLSDKYIAGFLDGDGSICVSTNPSNGRKYLRLSFGQKISNDGVLDLISQRFSGGVFSEWKSTRDVVETHARMLMYNGQRAVDMLCRLKPYLVTKGQRAIDILLELGYEERVGKKRKFVLPNYPARKWLAGYFDADGCISGQLQKKSGAAHIAVRIATNIEQMAGIELVQKVHGGHISHTGNNRAVGRQWQVYMDAAKVKAFFPPFMQYLLNKREQAYFIYGCASMGHFRDGKAIVNTLSVMKTRPHRLNDLTSGVDVSRELAMVRDLLPLYDAQNRRISRDEAIVRTGMPVKQDTYEANAVD